MVQVHYITRCKSLHDLHSLRPPALGVKNHVETSASWYNLYLDYSCYNRQFKTWCQTYLETLQLRNPVFQPLKVQTTKRVAFIGVRNGCYGPNCIGKESLNKDVCVIALGDAFLTKKSLINKKQVVLDAENRGHCERLVETQRIKVSAIETAASDSLN